MYKACLEVFYHLSQVKDWKALTSERSTSQDMSISDAFPPECACVHFWLEIVYQYLVLAAFFTCPVPALSASTKFACAKLPALSLLYFSSFWALWGHCTLLWMLVNVHEHQRSHPNEASNSNTKHWPSQLCRCKARTNMRCQSAACAWALASKLHCLSM